MTRSQLAVLERHGWPGNIRELKNVIERAAISSTGSRLRIDLALPAATRQPPAAGTSSSLRAADFLTVAEFRELEKANITAALRHTEGRVWGARGAAEMLGLNPSTLKYRMKQLGIERPRR